MSVDDLDRELRMQERLNALMRLWQIDNGDSHFELRYDGCSDLPWTLHHSWFDGGYESADDTSTRSTGAEAWEDFHGKTFALAIEMAWEHHGRWLVCSSCDGAGQHERRSAGGAQVPVRDEESEYITHDGEQVLTWPCGTCGGEGVVQSSSVLSTATS